MNIFWVGSHYQKSNISKQIDGFYAIKILYIKLLYYVRASEIAAPSCAGDLTVLTPAASSEENLSSAVPLPPDIIAPACPIRLPGGAVTPAI